MTYRRLKILDYTTVTVLTLVTAIILLGVATCRHANAAHAPNTTTCYGYVRNIDEKIGGVGTECLFERKTWVGKIILKACGPGNYCRVVTKYTPEGIAGNKDIHPITVIFGIDTLLEDGKNPDPPLTKKRNCSGPVESTGDPNWYKVDDCQFAKETEVFQVITDKCDLVCKLVVYGNYTDKKDFYITKVISARAPRFPHGTYE